MPGWHTPTHFSPSDPPGTFLERRFSLVYGRRPVPVVLEPCRAQYGTGRSRPPVASVQSRGIPAPGKPIRGLPPLALQTAARFAALGQRLTANGTLNAYPAPAGTHPAEPMIVFHQAPLLAELDSYRLVRGSDAENLHALRLKANQGEHRVVWSLEIVGKRGR